VAVTYNCYGSGRSATFRHTVVRTVMKFHLFAGKTPYKYHSHKGRLHGIKSIGGSRQQSNKTATDMTTWKHIDNILCQSAVMEVIFFASS
jgi:hypothetical protein